MKSPLKTMHLFAGQGGGLLGDLILGHNPIIAVEWDKYACELLREKATEGWFPNLHVWEGDVRLFDPSKYKGKVDCLHAGFPCQDISVAGKQAGVGEGTRSGLYREVLRIASTLRVRYIFLENVAAIINNGLGTVLEDLSKMGYDCRWCVVSASDVGANHQRERWWCLCILRDSKSFNGEERNLSEKSLVRRAQIQSGRPSSSSGISESRNNTESTNTVRHVANTCSFGQVHRQSEIKPAEAGINAQRRTVSSSADVPNTNGTGYNPTEQSRIYTTQTRKRITNNTANVCSRERNASNTSSCRQSAQKYQPQSKREPLEERTPDNTGNGNWWQVSSEVCRMANGVADKLHKKEIDSRLFGLGNGQVPLQCAVAWKILTRDLGI